MNKTEKVTIHLLEKGTITPLEAYKEYGTMRLSDIIYRLRNRGMNITTEKTIFIDRYGDKSYYAKYILEDQNEKSKRRNGNDRKKRRLFRKAERV